MLSFLKLLESILEKLNDAQGFWRKWFLWTVCGLS